MAFGKSGTSCWIARHYTTIRAAQCTRSACWIGRTWSQLARIRRRVNSRLSSQAPHRKSSQSGASSSGPPRTGLHKLGAGRTLLHRPGGRLICAPAPRRRRRRKRPSSHHHRPWHPSREERSRRRRFSLHRPCLARAAGRRRHQRHQRHQRHPFHRHAHQGCRPAPHCPAPRPPLPARQLPRRQPPRPQALLPRLLWRRRP